MGRVIGVEADCELPAGPRQGESGTGEVREGRRGGGGG